MRKSPSRSLSTKEYERGLEIQQNIEFLLQPNKGGMVCQLDGRDKFNKRLLESTDYLCNRNEEIPEERNYPQFYKYFIRKWLWMSSSIPEAMTIYLKFRDSYDLLLAHCFHESPYYLDTRKYFSPSIPNHNKVNVGITPR